MPQDLKLSLQKWLRWVLAPSFPSPWANHIPTRHARMYAYTFTQTSSPSWRADVCSQTWLNPGTHAWAAKHRCPHTLISVSVFVSALFGGFELSADKEHGISLTLPVFAHFILLLWSVLCCYIWQPTSSFDLYKEHVGLLFFFLIVWNMLIQQDGKSSCISKVKNNRHESFRKDSKAFSHKSSLCSNTWFIFPLLMLSEASNKEGINDTLNRRTCWQHSN